MNKTDNDVANAQSESRGVSDLHDLRLTSLLFDLVEAHGRVKAAETLGVSYGALARAADTGRLSGRMRDALARHLLDGAAEFDEKHREQLAELERRLVTLEEVAGDTPRDEDSQVVGLRKALTKIGEELERHGRRIASLESRGPWPRLVPAPVAEHPAPSRPVHELVVSLHPDPGDDEKRFGAAAPLVVEWRRLREGNAPRLLVS